MNTAPPPLPTREEIALLDTFAGLELRRHEGYDHGYYFIQSFMADHLAHHANTLNT